MVERLHHQRVLENGLMVRSCTYCGEKWPCDGTGFEDEIGRYVQQVADQATTIGIYQRFTTHLLDLLQRAPDHYRTRHGITLPDCGYLIPDLWEDEEEEGDDARTETE